MVEEQNSLVFEVKETTSKFGKKPRIKKGYYTGCLIEVKSKKNDGTGFTNSYGSKQVVLVFSVLDEEGKPVVLKEENKETDVILSQWLTTAYKNDDGTFNTAFTSNSKTTKVFKALGWKFEEGSIDLNKFIGKRCEINVDDYDAKITEDGKEVVYKASFIKDINVIEEDDSDAITEE